MAPAQMSTKNTGTTTESDYEKVSKKLSLGDSFEELKKLFFNLIP